MIRIGWRWLAAATLLLTVPLAACGKEDVPVQELFALRNQGLLYLQRGQLPEAEAQFSRLVDLAPREPLGHANLGLTYLRAGRYDEAEPHLERAHELDPGSVDIALMLARLYVLTERPGEARDLLEEMDATLGAGTDPRLAFALAELDEGATDPAGIERYRSRLRAVLAASPTTLPARLRLAASFLAAGAADSALRQLEEVRRIPPEPPAEAAPSLSQAMELIGDGDLSGAAAALERFHRAMEVTAPYQEALAELGWVEGTLVGTPVLTFAPEEILALRGAGADSARVTFVEATAEAGLPGGGQSGEAGATVLAVGDVDGDGRPDLLLAGPGGASLFRVQGGLLREVTEESGIAVDGTAAAATFADYDNDGWLDLLVVAEDGGVRLFRNRRDGSFEEVGAAAGLAAAPGTSGAAFVDLDHDGDLDLVLFGEGALSVRRNNLDGTFTDVTGAFGLAGAAGTDLDFADLNGDGRIDLLLTGGARGATLLLNEGARSFRDASAAAGLEGAGNAVAGTIADFGNDGYLDLLLMDATGAARVWTGRGDGTFGSGPVVAPAAGPGGGGRALAAIDYDNDGWLDAVLGAGEVRLRRNAGRGDWGAPAARVPEGPGAADAIRPTDMDDDGDLDLLVVRAGGGVALLRNDGGNLRRAMRVQLNALGTGSGKNNGFGIGARLELRAGELLQTRVVSDPVTHLGLGPHLKADVLRVEWPNGVPQTLYFPGTDQDVLEIENLKGSCAFLYTWDGERFRFVTDVTWRSALGMPVGLMGSGSALYAPAQASREYLRIPGEALRPRDGRYVLQLTEELWETAYMDEVRLLAVDHPDSVEIYVDERFVPPGPVELRIYPTTGARPPLSAVDDQGNDLLPALREKDDVYVDNLVPLRYQGLVEPHDLILDLGEQAGEAGMLLLLRGWIYPTDASINIALSQQDELRPMPLALEVKDASGRWVTAMPALGFPSGKDKTMVIELEGIFPTDDHHVRIRTNLQIYWDQALVAREDPSIPARVATLEPLSADLHFRGFSRMYRKGGRHGPHWFDYASVTEESPWRPIRGAFTRFGDVRPLLDGADDRYVIMAPGDETTVEFDAATAEEVQAGWRRDFLLYTNGWIKDSDLNTAFGDTVEPLPFQGIQQYPYANGESYPTDAEHQRYLREYNTRVLDGR